MSPPRNPYPTVDIIIEIKGGIVLVRRKNPPPGWALPGGFIDYAESAEAAAVREAREETGLTVRLTGLLGVYSSPDRDPRFHTLSVVYTAEPEGDEEPRGGDDAAQARVFPVHALPRDMAFDHAAIIADYLAYRRDGTRPAPRQGRNPEDAG